MAPERQIFDPDGDVLFILSSTSKLTLEELGLTNQPQPDSPHVLMQVSSKHLMLASPVFKAMLTSPFSEGQTLARTGHVDIELPEDDCVAFTILMNVIHSKGRKVPSVLSLKLLAIVSMLVDKYQLQEIAAVFSDIWIREMALVVTYFYDDTVFYDRNIDVLTHWLLIAWVFRHTVLFEEVSKALVQAARFPLPAVPDEVPIPQSIFDAIDARRMKCLSEIFREVSGWVDHYHEKPWNVSCTGATETPSSVSCTSTTETRRNCDTQVLGSLIRACSVCFIWPTPKRPYTGHSVQGVLERIAELNVISLCDILHPERSNNKGHWVANDILEVCNELYLQGGLDIGVFAKDCAEQDSKGEN
ncbi:uncharacterized protein LY89DRAFT_734964 [Mollisia scopiformis]|uniref:BTB domain-containing protein n=1 Tax=Mollisia scopiformis TaxID=149040 RepID=A0A194X6L3_MOLSC|nr:uncharacterized protein LY89DRAFT_734964 [Mollisia scopiformis]KUJ15815.1 hypothetical protein LY89DRAFT_734964 [Mollisia scopiformis]